MILSHAIGDLCLVGPKGCGKSLIIDQFASLLNYPIEYFVLYKDLSARELLQQRITNANGDTLWQNTPLVEAALHGRLLVLDGIHRLNNDTLVSLQRIIQDRELFLPDGTRLLRYGIFIGRKTLIFLRLILVMIGTIASRILRQLFVAFILPFELLLLLNHLLVIILPPPMSQNRPVNKIG